MSCLLLSLLLEKKIDDNEDNIKQHLLCCQKLYKLSRLLSEKMGRQPGQSENTVEKWSEVV